MSEITFVRSGSDPNHWAAMLCGGIIGSWTPQYASIGGRWVGTPSLERWKEMFPRGGG